MRNTIVNNTVWILQIYLSFFVFHIITASLFREFSPLNPLAKIYQHALWLEPIFLLFVFLVLVLFSFRALLSFILTCLFFITLLFANVEKAATLQIPIFPSDLLSIQELFYLEDSLSYLWPLLILLTVLILLIGLALKMEKPSELFKNSRKITWPTLLVSILVFNYFRDDISAWVTNKRIWNLNTSMLNVAERTGFLTFFFRRIIDYKESTLPEQYSKEKIIEIALKYKTNNKSIAKDRPNVIIFLIEAFNDPKLTALKTSYDPIPNFRKIAQTSTSGNILVPVVGGLSANSEFELLTGLSMRFIPKNSIPYIDAVSHPIPSIARELKQIGYETSAIHVASMRFFNYQLVYPSLGFDNYYTLAGKQGLKKDPANRYVSEKSLVQEIIQRTNSPKPQFIFSFPNSTHGPWNYDAYLNSDLEVLNWPILNKQKQLKTYINALHSADQAIGELVEYYRKSNEDTIILIAGDHLPGFRPYNLMKIIKDFQLDNTAHKTIKQNKKLGAFYRFIEMSNPEKFHVSTHRTPYLIWTNFAPSKQIKNSSINLIHSKIFDLIGHSRSPLYQLTNVLQKEIEELSLIVKESKNKYQFETPKKHQSLMNDYELLQYDILYGKNYYMQWQETTIQ